MTQSFSTIQYKNRLGHVYQGNFKKHFFLIFDMAAYLDHFDNVTFGWSKKKVKNFFRSSHFCRSKNCPPPFWRVKKLSNIFLVNNFFETQKSSTTFLAGQKTVQHFFGKHFFVKSKIVSHIFGRSKNCQTVFWQTLFRKSKNWRTVFCLTVFRHPKQLFSKFPWWSIFCQQFSGITFFDYLTPEMVVTQISGTSTVFEKRLFEKLFCS